MDINTITLTTVEGKDSSVCRLQLSLDKEMSTNRALEIIALLKREDSDREGYAFAWKGHARCPECGSTSPPQTFVTSDVS